MAARSLSIAASSTSNRSTATAQSRQGLDLARDGPIGAPLQDTAQLVHLVERVKTIVALLSLGEYLTHPGRDPRRRILDHHRQRQSLRAALAQHLRPALGITPLAQLKREQQALSRSTPANTGSP